jgi:hemolysin III
MSSTLYHSFPAGKIKKFFHLLDHSSIFLLIAGTYTPVLLISLKGAVGWTFFFIIWGIAFSGITLKIFYTGKFKYLSIGLYLCMGWMLIFLLKPMLEKAPMPLLLWLVIGGIFYTSGIIFYVWKKLPFHHSVWHVFVMLGSLSHFLGIVIFLSSAD